MITTRAMTEQDQPALQAAIKRDTFHPGAWSVDDFIFEPDSNYEKKRLPKICTVIEDQNGPITFVRFTKTVSQARANGFTEIIIQTDHDKLATFLTDVMKMTKSGNEYLLAV